ncbi:TonB-dependent siderophore receptor [Actimicrobium sp. CCC2.4]|uniref:TonB-dependent receptor n=1 Tax=Actimicrobium sp. CCC2.4 TaxID=3048606 RepID=UPI002AC8B066|nr:TonB-dependent siderophore receptor [Actimicrobium sp. CCC2.4]MEB0135873.1 TonB-dependent siderophore receptor [Actimicrobium sp. CCC2.4]WPX33349.1 TonB-dependent siderophore receptor [Actimicrobium sp. CCC2.4]
MLYATGAAAQTELVEVLVEGTSLPPYVGGALSSPKYTRPLADLPQTITVIPDQLMAEQGVKSLRDALRNITGISMQAGEGNPPSGDQLKIRGFSARDDILIDGVRDVGNYFRDPFFIEQIEVTKGPSSAFAGRGSTGGTINQVSKAPRMNAFREIEVSAGTDDLKRLTVDLNAPIETWPGAALRLNLMAHEADQAGRDQVSNRRWGVAPTLAFGLGTATRVTLGFLHTEQDNLADSGIPNSRNFSLAGSGFEGRIAPVDTRHFYGYTTDYQRLTSDQGSVKIVHEFNESVSLHNQLRVTRTHNDSVFSSPRYAPGNLTTIDADTRVVGNQKPRDQIDQVLINQTDLTVKFNTGRVANTLVVGTEFSRQKSENRRRLDTNGSTTSLFDPVARAATALPYNGTRAQLDTDQAAIYVFDTMKLTPQWELNGGLRYDYVKTSVRGIDDSGRLPGYVSNLAHVDKQTSGSLGLVYKPVPQLSLYAGYGTSFDTSGRADLVQLAGGNNNVPIAESSFRVAPEKSRSVELGSKWAVLNNQLDLNAAIFRTEKTNARTPGLPGEPPLVLDGIQRVNGLELSVAGRINSNWNVFGGYTYLDGQVTRSNTAFEVGQRLDNMPRHSISAWTTYQLTPKLTVGGGVQYMDARNSNIRGDDRDNFTITAAPYWVGDAVASYRVNASTTLRLNIYNVANKTYTYELASGQSIPGPGRSATLAAQFAF